MGMKMRMKGVLNGSSEDGKGWRVYSRRVVVAKIYRGKEHNCTRDENCRRKYRANVRLVTAGWRMVNPLARDSLADLKLGKNKIETRLPITYSLSW